MSTMHPCQIDLRTNPNAYLPEQPERVSRMVGDYSWWICPCGTWATAPDRASTIQCWNCQRYYPLTHHATPQAGEEPQG